MNKAAYIHIDEHLISSSLKCPICLDILEDPYTHITCDSAFCRTCLLQLTEPLCPICRWTWDETIPLQYNIYLPKTNRLIRNMLDDLYVQCLHCQTIRRRGQFEHECQPQEKPCLVLSMNSSKKSNTLQTIFSSLVLFSFVLFIYFYRHFVFEQAISRQNQLINEIAYNLDYYLLEKFYSLFLNLIEYSMTTLIFNICIWLSIVFYGDRITSKTNSRLLKKVFETTTIINLLVYSFFNYEN